MCGGTGARRLTGFVNGDARKGLLIFLGMLCLSLFEAGGRQRRRLWAQVARVFHGLGRVRVAWGVQSCEDEVCVNHKKEKNEQGGRSFHPRSVYRS